MCCVSYQQHGGRWWGGTCLKGNFVLLYMDIHLLCCANFCVIHKQCFCILSLDRRTPLEDRTWPEDRVIRGQAIAEEEPSWRGQGQTAGVC